MSRTLVSSLDDQKAKKAQLQKSIQNLRQRQTTHSHLRFFRLEKMYKSKFKKLVVQVLPHKVVDQVVWSKAKSPAASADAAPAPAPAPAPSAAASSSDGSGKVLFDGKLGIQHLYIHIL